jgi:RHS repeat-associated protein
LFCFNQLTTSGATALGYDSRGNLTNSGSSTYTYNAENRMVTGPAGFYLTYEPGGQNRILQLYTPSTDIRFAYWGPHMVAEMTGGVIQRRYVFGPGDDAPLVWYEGAGTTNRRWLIPDERGSIIAVTNASGVVTNVNRYDDYGVPASTNAGRFQYTGQAWLPELQMYYYKARIYAPTLGRFLQTDPTGYDDGPNWYDYVGGDPVNNSDPTGLEGCCYGPEGYRLPQMEAPSLSTLGNAILAIAIAFDIVNSPLSPGPDASIAGAAARGALSRTEQAAARAEVRAGRYEFPDKTAGGKPYVGQSGNVPARLADHTRAGRLELGAARTTPVTGGKAAREVSEHRRIQQITGGKPARESDAVSNKVDPIGPKRRHLLKEGD